MFSFMKIRTTMRCIQLKLKFRQFIQTINNNDNNNNNNQRLQIRRYTYENIT